MTTAHNAGTTVKISASLPSTYDASGYNVVAGLATIGEVTAVPEYGGNVWSGQTHNPISHSGTEFVKTKFDPGEMTVQLALDASDAGQVICEAAVASRNSYTFLITQPDGTKNYCIGKVLAYRPAGVNQDGIKMATLQVRFTCSSTGVGWVRG
jgi:hypothetical protein